MPGGKVFFDSNVLIYLISDDEAKAAKADNLLKKRGVVRILVLNDFASVARRKNKLDWEELHQALGSIRRLCDVIPLTYNSHEEGHKITERYGFSIYNSMIIAAAIVSGCDTIYSEDLQDGQIIGHTRVSNPF